MVFLISNKNERDIFYTHNPKRAMEVVFYALKENDGESFGIYGTKSKELFLLIYPEFKGRYFVSI